MNLLAKNDNGPGIYEPEIGDLIAITDVIPKCIDDLNGPKQSYVVALVQGMRDEDSNKIPVLSSKPILFGKADGRNGKIGNGLFAVYLTNLTTSMRIWNVLHPCKGGFFRIISTVLRIDPYIDENCTLCSIKMESTKLSKSWECITSLGLDESQKEAVLNCSGLAECHHQNSVKLICGPPGT